MHARSLLFILLTPIMTQAQAPVISSVTPLTPTVEQYGKFEATVGLTASYTNPFDYDQISLRGIFTAPDGSTYEVDGFFMQEFQPPNPQSGSISPIGNGVFKIRFSPRQAGLWQYTVQCITPAGTADFSVQNFTCTSIQNPSNKGFVRAGQTNYLFFDNGAQYIPIGENIAWHLNNPYLNYNNWLTQLGNNGGNFFRLWQCHWGLGLEWQSGDYQGLRRYQQNNAAYLDWLFDYCSGNGIYVMWCFQHHGQVSTQVNPSWSANPYNALHGGPCVNTWDFFTNAAAIAHTKNRYRYTVARWGYSRSIMAWELFNEVDWTNEYETRQSDIAAWHAEMAAFIKQIDPQEHLVTTSFAYDYNDHIVWNLPDIDLTQTHYYINTPNIERVLSGGIRNYLDDFGKPTLNAEFGLTASGSGLSSVDPDGIHFHNCLWGAFFSGAMGSAQTWWWDSYIEPQNLYYHFAPVAAVVEQVDFHNGDFRPASAVASGVSADLTLTPSQGWGTLSDTSIVISENGQVTPSPPGLGQYLYGSAWNTQFRRPPTFYVNFPQSGFFEVKTGTATGQNPKIAIRLDGVLVLEQNAQVNQTYQIAVPAGSHTIGVDNTGTDWITISSYSFSDIGNAVDVYALKNSEGNKLAGWVVNNRYNHDYIAGNGTPPVASGAFVSISGVNSGGDMVNFFDCLTGALVSAEPAIAENDTLVFSLPEVLWDLAFVIDGEPVGVTETMRQLPLQLSPNPVASGPVDLTFSLDAAAPVKVSLLDASGRQLQTCFEGELSTGYHKLNIDISSSYPAGLYWIVVRAGDRAGTQTLVVARL